MPLPSPKKNETKKEFLSRCMGDKTTNKDFPDNGQRYAVCNNRAKGFLLESVCLSLVDEDMYGFDEDIDMDSIFIPDHKDYLDFEEDGDMWNVGKSHPFSYRDPVTNEIYQYQKRGVYEKNGRLLMYMGDYSESSIASDKHKNVKLNKPFRTPGGPKKFSVYVKNDKGNIVKVNFGDPNMEIKRDDPARRKSYRARHNCENPGPKWKANYWSCKMWSTPNVSDLT